MNSSAKTILGLIAAGAAGVAIGMLLAPQKGSDLRQSLKESAGDLSDKLHDLLAAGKEKAEDVVDTVKEQAQGLKKDAKGRYDNAKEALS